MTPNQKETLMKSTPTRMLTAGVIAACVLGLTACGGANDDGDQTASEPETTASTPAQGGTGQGALDAKTLKEIRECLKAAGLDDAFPSGDAPSGMPSDLPSDLPSDFPTEMPSDFPDDMPSGFPSEMPSGAAGAGGLNDPEIQEALDACGIALPSPGQQ